jgi:hypothetical protein
VYTLSIGIFNFHLKPDLRVRNMKAISYKDLLFLLKILHFPCTEMKCLHKRCQVGFLPLSTSDRLENIHYIFHDKPSCTARG